MKMVRAWVVLALLCGLALAGELAVKPGEKIGFLGDSITALGTQHPGGYTRAVKTFEFGDVKVRTTLTDHNDYLIDYTTAFEVTIGDFVIYHSGDCSNAKKLKPLCPNPDLWMFHPWSCMKPLDGARAVNPKLAVVAHLNELGHSKDRWRFTWAEGEGVRQKLEDAGFNAVVPLWGDRIC